MVRPEPEMRAITQASCTFAAKTHRPPRASPVNELAPRPARRGPGKALFR